MSSLTAPPISGLEVTESNHGLRPARATKKKLRPIAGFADAQLGRKARLRTSQRFLFANKPETATVRVNDKEPHPFRNATVSAVSLMLYNMYIEPHELMAMTVVPIRLSRQDARKLDLLVRLGLYNSRTEAMRAMIQATADEQLNRYMLNDRVKEALNELLQAEKRHGENPLHIASKKTAAEIVAESRQ